MSLNSEHSISSDHDESTKSFLKVFYIVPLILDLYLSYSQFKKTFFQFFITGLVFIFFSSFSMKHNNRGVKLPASEMQQDVSFFLHVWNQGGYFPIGFEDGFE